MGAPAGIVAGLLPLEGAPLAGRRLSEVEDQIGQGWVATASGYQEIRDDRLYLQDRRYTDFDAYCRDRWGVSRNFVDKMIMSYEVVERLRTNGTEIPLPANERQARALLPLLERPDEMAAALEEARSEAKAKHQKLTAQRIGAAVKRRLPPQDGAAAEPMGDTAPEDEQFTQTRAVLQQVVVRLGHLSQGLGTHVDAQDFSLRELRDLASLVERFGELAGRGETLLYVVRARRRQRDGAPMPRVVPKQRGGDGMQKQALLQGLRELGPSTTRELLAVTGLDLYVASSRMSELRRDGRVVDTGERRKGKGSRLDKVYAVAGSEEVRP